MLEEALHELSKSSNKSEQEIIHLLRSGEPSCHSELRYELALQVVGFLASNAKVMKRVYLYGSVTDNSAGPTSDIDIIIEVERKNKYLEGLIQIYDKDLLSEYKNIMAGKADSLEKLLDVQFIDEEDIKNHSSYGSVGNWQNPPALKIYDAEEKSKIIENRKNLYLDKTYNIV